MKPNKQIFSDISGIYVDELDFLLKEKSSSVDPTISNDLYQGRTIEPQGYAFDNLNLSNEELSNILASVNCDGQYHDDRGRDCDEEIHHLADDGKEMSLESTMSFSDDSSDGDWSMEEEILAMKIAGIIVEYVGITRTCDEAMANLLSNAMNDLHL